MFYHGATNENLVKGIACPECKRIVGHHIDCSHYKDKDITGASSRAKLFNAAAVLWAKSPDKSFITFTLPSRRNAHTGKNLGYYQASAACSTTGDLAVTEKFSQVLEAWAKRHRRTRRELLQQNAESVHPLSYVWIAEGQMKRRKKHGGIGDLHFHLVANVKIKDINDKWTDAKGVTHYRTVDRELLKWLQDTWCKAVGVSSSNCVHVDPIPDDIRSIPGYLVKYFDKGTPRRILSRKFSATRDLTRYKPISLQQLPSCELEGSTDITTKTGYEMTLNYYNTRQVLEQFAGVMADESQLQVAPYQISDKVREHLQDAAWLKLQHSYRTELEEVLHGPAY